jgi:hypothetical protein
MLRRAQQALETPLDQGDTYRDPQGTLLPGTVHLLQGVINLEPQVRESLPDLLPAFTQARENMLVSLSVETQKLLVQPGREVSITQEKTFDEKLESAQKIPDVNRRDQIIAIAILSAASDTQSLAAASRLRIFRVIIKLR